MATRKIANWFLNTLYAAIILGVSTSTTVRCIEHKRELKQRQEDSKILAKVYESREPVIGFHGESLDSLIQKGQIKQGDLIQAYIENKEDKYKDLFGIYRGTENNSYLIQSEDQESKITRIEKNPEYQIRRILRKTTSQPEAQTKTQPKAQPETQPKAQK